MAADSVSCDTLDMLVDCILGLERETAGKASYEFAYLDLSGSLHLGKFGYTFDEGGTSQPEICTHVHVFSGWEDCQVRYSDIDEITYQPDGVSDGENGRRTNGFGNLKMSMGEFYSDCFGDYIRYTFQDCQAHVVLHVKGEVVVINGEDPVATEKIFEILESRCGRRIAGK